MLPSRSRFKSFVYVGSTAKLIANYLGHHELDREVWITFDDGPHPLNTPRILSALQRHDVRATFFFIGKQAEQYPEIVARAVAEGHHIGNHSYSHPFLTRLDRAAIRQEIIRADTVLAPYYQGSKLFRPPHGDYDATVHAIATEVGYQMVLWNLSTRDWNRPFQPHAWVTLGTWLTRMIPSAVILMHADLDCTADHLDEFLGHIRRLDVRFMPPDTLLQSWQQPGKFT
jgi:peptidoglycan-N-acetylglucosamine deacetylase